MAKGFWVALATTTLMTGCATTPEDTTPYERYTLANGMEVLIWPNRNSESNNEVRMELVVKAGSEDERPDQAGLAHFVEHMAFEQRDGSGNNPIDAWLYGLGVEHQSHANAYTTFDHTRYYLQFNGTAPERLEKGVKAFAHIASQTHFDSQEVEQEKAVIEAEWRYRENTEKADDILFKANLSEHPWREQLAIGDMEVISHATPQQLSDFYQTHYRPVNAFLVVAGDVDLPTLKQQINDAFSSWSAPESAYQPADDVMVVPQPSILKLTAPDLTGSYVMLEGFSDDWLIDSEDDLYRIEMLGAIFDVLQQRLDRVANQEQMTMDLFAYYGRHISHPHLGSLVLEAVGDTDAMQQALSLLAREWARMAQYGLTQDELDRWRESVLSNERNNLDSAKYLADLAVDSLLYGDLLQGHKQYLEYLEKALPAFTPEQSQALASDVLAFTPRITLVPTPSAATPTDQQLRDWSRWPQKVAVPMGFVGQKEAWTVTKQPGQILSQETLPSGIKVFRLSNGMEVMYSRHKGNADWVDIQFVGLGGLDALSDDEAISARLALSVMAASGLGNLDGEALSHWLNERSITINPYFTYFTRELQLAGPSKQIKSMFRLAHAALSEAQVNEHVLEHHKRSALSYIQRQASGNRDEFDRRVEQAMYHDDTRLRRLTEQDIENVSKQDIESIYHQYFAGAQNYKMYIVGDLEPAELERYLTQYIANISNQSADYLSTVDYPKLQKSERIVGDGVGGEATFITLMYEVDAEDYPWVNLSLLKAEAKQLSSQLTSVIREDQGLTYAISADFIGGSRLNNTVQLRVDFSAAPDEVDDAINAVNQQILVRARQPIDTSEIDAALVKHRNEFDEAVASDGRLMIMATADMFNRSKATLFDASHSVSSYNAKQVHQLYRALMGDQARHVEFILNP